MYVILCYDVGIKRNAKARKIARQFLRPVQKSVCEGFITESKLRKLSAHLEAVIDPEEDAVVFYKMNTGPDFEKISIGQSTQNEDFIL